MFALSYNLSLSAAKLRKVERKTKKLLSFFHLDIVFLIFEGKIMKIL